MRLVAVPLTRLPGVAVLQTDRLQLSKRLKRNLDDGDRLRAVNEGSSTTMMTAKMTTTTTTMMTMMTAGITEDQYFIYVVCISIIPAVRLADSPGESPPQAAVRVASPR